MSNPNQPENTTAESTQDEAHDTQTTEETLGDAGKKALDAEREARKTAEKQARETAKRLAEYEKREAEAEEAKLTEIQKLEKRLAEAEAKAAAANLASQRNAALAKYPVPEEYQDLVQGTDAESFEASAKKLHNLYQKTQHQDDESFDHSMPSTGKTPKNIEGSYQSGVLKARADFAKTNS